MKGPTAKRRQNKAQAKRRAYALVCRAVDARDGMGCRLCYAYCEVAEHHHIVYRSRGGKDTTGNIIRICQSCHHKIHDKKLRVTGDGNGSVIASSVISATERSQ